MAEDAHGGGQPLRQAVGALVPNAHALAGSPPPSAGVAWSAENVLAVVSGSGAVVFAPSDDQHKRATANLRRAVVESVLPGDEAFADQAVLADSKFNVAFTATMRFRRKRLLRCVPQRIDNLTDGRLLGYYRELMEFVSNPSATGGDLAEEPAARRVAWSPPCVAPVSSDATAQTCTCLLAVSSENGDVFVFAPPHVNASALRTTRFDALLDVTHALADAFEAGLGAPKVKGDSTPQFVSWADVGGAEAPLDTEETVLKRAAEELDNDSDGMGFDEWVRTHGKKRSKKQLCLRLGEPVPPPPPAAGKATTPRAQRQQVVKEEVETAVPSPPPSAIKKRRGRPPKPGSDAFLRRAKEDEEATLRGAALELPPPCTPRCVPAGRA